MPVLKRTAALTWYSAGPSMGEHISYELKGLGSEGRSLRPELPIMTQLAASPVEA